MAGVSYTSARVDVVIYGGTVAAGNGYEHGPASILVKSGRIMAIEHLESEAVTAGHAIDARGLMVAPGFIDTHVHSEAELLRDPRCTSALMQGVTTHVMGQDGLSFAPLSSADYSDFCKFLAPIYGLLPADVDTESVSAFRSRFDGGVSVNTVYVIPHGTVRFGIAGMRNGKLVSSEIGMAADAVRLGLDQGGAGFSTGLSYFPGSYADTDELVALARVARDFSVPYVTHVRSVFPYGRVAPISEALEISRRSGAGLHISHFRTGPETVGHVDELFAALDAAYEGGEDVTIDTYPYSYGSGPLYICLPAWVFDGGFDKAMERLEDGGLRGEICRGIENNDSQVGGIVTHAKGHEEYEGKDFRDIASGMHSSLTNTLCNLLLECELDVTFHHGSDDIVKDGLLEEKFEADFIQIMSRPYAMVGSDAIYLGRDPHPRAFATFPKALRIARERGFGIGEFVRRTCKNAAERFRLGGRGVIEPGAWADLVVFDPKLVSEGSEPLSLNAHPSGVSAVLVNGEIAVQDCEPTGRLFGKSLSPA